MAINHRVDNNPRRRLEDAARMYKEEFQRALDDGHPELKAVLLGFVKDVLPTIKSLDVEITGRDDGRVTADLLYSALENDLGHYLYYLSDGGYTRLVIDLETPGAPPVGIDSGTASPRTLEKWNKLKATRSAGERYQRFVKTATAISRILENARKKYPPAGSVVDGLSVKGPVSDIESIGASLENYEVLSGVREVSMRYFGPYNGPESMFYDARDIRRAADLAEKVKISRKITPLIVIEDKEGPYLLEGLHRYVAIRELGKKSFPAIVAVDMGLPPSWRR